MIKKVFSMVFLSGLMGYSYSETCSPPVFEKFDNLQNLVKPLGLSDSQEFTRVRMMRIASLRLPSPFLDVIYSSSLGFRTPSKDLSVNVSYQGVDDIIEMGVDSVTPYRFFDTMFESPNGEVQCMYLKMNNLDGQDYRVMVALSGGKVFAYGAKDMHYVYVTNENFQDKIAFITLKTLNVNYVLDVINSIQLME